MSSPRSRLAVWNFASGLLFTALTMVTGLFATPLLIQWLGKERYGLSRMIVEVFGYLALLELGLGGGLGAVLARALAADDRPALRGALSAGLRVYLGATAATLAAGALLAVVINRLIPAPPALTADLRLAGFVTLGGFATLALSPFRALAEAEQRGFRVNLLLAAQSLVVTGTALALARSGGGIAGQAGATALGTVLVALALAGEGVRRRPGLLRGAVAAPPDREALRSLGRLSSLVLVVQLSGRISFMTDSYVVGRILGADRVAALVATTRLAQLAQSQLLMIGNASWAGLADLHGRGERDAFNAKLIELSGLIALLGTAGLVPVVALNHAFVAIWMRGRDVAYGGDLMTLAAAVVALMQGLTSLWCWCFAGTGRLGRIAPAQLVAALINLGASVALTAFRGLPGPVLGTLVAFLAVNLWFVPMQLRRTFGTPLGALARAVVRPVVPGLAYGAAIWGLARHHRPPGWIGLAAESGAAALGFLALAWAFLLSPDDRRLWGRRLRGSLPGPLRRRLPGFSEADG